MPVRRIQVAMQVAMTPPCVLGYKGRARSSATGAGMASAQDRNTQLDGIHAAYRVDRGRSFRLASVDPADIGPFDHDDKSATQALLRSGVERLATLQDRLYAQDRWSVLLIFQAMDAAGKDGVIKHVLSGINPQGCHVTSFKAPSNEELDHDYLWRCFKSLPERGRIGIFNRSYYEEVLIVKVHRGLLDAQKLPPALVNSGLWKHRYEDIRNAEQYLTRNGTVIRKFFLHVSRDEQRRRFLERIDNRDKNWKFAMADVRERGHWDAYMAAYERMIRETSTPYAPWYVVPADNKWYTRLVVAGAIVDALAGIKLHYPRIDGAKRAELAAARAELLREPARKRSR
jgi:PPK2 family polyphosphate:nucleotide phosphotransferase